ncbi:hypothetical protein [Aureimonas sp. AU20]|uniref:hypothetical protein n=1 Tax=Aureimonas sp. AU20 TaxID=1349819 RepID=UPI0007230A45|nr:hypothetical protein [Aureimonas sp. AU20]ALN74647.1 hypothetical protein M673_18165 [Aureimonas sp. AU20]
MRFLAASIASLLVASPALAGSSNVLTLSPNQDASNRIELLLTGNDNQLSLSQTSSASSPSGNSMTINVQGDRNGGKRSSSKLTPTLIADLPWGSLSQTGHSNAMDISVSGSDNLFAAVQQGSSNVMRGSIVGNGNGAAVSQSGQNNLASFSQIGKGNMISITQRSW